MSTSQRSAMETPLPTRPLGRTDMRSPASASAPGRSAAPAGPSAGAARTTASRSPRSATRSSAASTGSTPPPSTASATPRRWSARALGDPAARSAATSSPSAAWSGTSTTATAPPRRVGDPASLRREVEASLRRLGVERIDLYQMHWPAEDGTPLEDYWRDAARPEGRGQGARRRACRTTTSASSSGRALGHVDSLQPPFSAIRRDAAAAELPWCDGARDRRHRLQPDAVRPAHRPLHRRARRARCRADDWRSRSPDFTRRGPDAQPRARRRAAADRGAARHDRRRRRGRLDARLARASPAPSSARAAPAQVDGWLDAATLELTADDLDEIAAAIDATGAGTGPVRPETATPETPAARARHG